MTAGDAQLRTGAFTISGRWKSVRHAYLGLLFMLRTQHNAWIHAAATVAVIAAGVALQVSVDDWRWLVVAIVMVWIAEALNTAFEHLCDVVSPEFHPSVKRSKDIAAGAVLLCAAGAVFVGVSVLLPHLTR
ncbi:MAG: diacylglycerol kinase family protein [Alphaproteobacteria bacterium]|nr:diacylglycerol kinase family protein [Alphaproteobacteria bacterium]